MKTVTISVEEYERLKENQKVSTVDRLISLHTKDPLHEFQDKNPVRMAYESLLDYTGAIN